MKVYEFLLWNNCNNNCKFCNVNTKEKSTIEDKINTIKKVSKKINNIKDKQFNILLVGGEIFFQYPENELMDLFYQTFYDERIKIIYINTNMLYDNNTEEYVFKILNMAKDMNRLKDIHWTTSCDIYGRFNELTTELFLKNLEKLSKKFNDLNIIVNVIIMKKLYELYNEHIFDKFRHFTKYINLIPLIKINKESDDLCLSRKEYFEFLSKLSQDLFDNFIRNLLSSEAEKRVIYDKDLNNLTEKDMSCNHNMNFMNCFCDSRECFICFLKRFCKEVRNVRIY